MTMDLLQIQPEINRQSREVGPLLSAQLFCFKTQNKPTQTRQRQERGQKKSGQWESKKKGPKERERTGIEAARG